MRFGRPTERDKKARKKAVKFRLWRLSIIILPAALTLMFLAFFLHGNPHFFENAKNDVAQDFKTIEKQTKQETNNTLLQKLTLNCKLNIAKEFELFTSCSSTGSLLELYKNTNAKSCKKICETDSKCVGYEAYVDTCKIYSTIYDGDAGFAEVGIKQ